MRRVTAQPGVDIVPSPNVKDELQLSGNSLEGVSQSAADIQQICRVRNKDIRKVSYRPDRILLQDLSRVYTDIICFSSWTVCTCPSGATLSRSKEWP